MNKHYLFCFITLAIYFFSTLSRSHFRKIDPRQGYISIGWSGDKNKITFNSPFLQYNSIFQLFDKKFFFKNTIDTQQIIYRKNKNKSVSGKTLSNIAQTAVEELMQGKNKLTHFNFIKKADFHKKTKTGILILKYKDFPFILKLFIESPKGFCNPYSKGTVPSCFFVMSGSIRHLLGFTRIKNLQDINKKIEKNSILSGIIETPRKWYWIYNNCKWLAIQEHNMSQDNKTTAIPSIYGVIADAIEEEKNKNISSKLHRKICIKVYNLFDCSIDPHSINIMLEKNTNKFVIIDTEYFPLIVGFRNKNKTNGYVSWLIDLSLKYIKDKYGHTKNERIIIQKAV